MRGVLGDVSMGIMSRLGSAFGLKDPRVAAAEAALRAVIDPDLGRDIVSLGFVRALTVDGPRAQMELHLTTPACPVRHDLQAQCERALRQVPGVTEVAVRLAADIPGLGRSGEGLPGVRNVIAVGAGKGGVGKSTVSLHLAFALREAGATVGIVDADVYGPSMVRMTGVGRPTRMRGEQVIPPEVDGIGIASMAQFASPGEASILRGPRLGGVLRQLLFQFAWDDRDYLIVDLPPGTGDVPLTLAQLVPLAGAVLVTSPQEVAVLDTRKALAMFSTLQVPVLGIVETMSHFACDCGRTHALFGEGGGRRLAAASGVPLLGQIPFDPRVVAAADGGRNALQLFPEGEVAAAFRAAAGALAAQVSVHRLEDADALGAFDLAWERS